MGRADDDSLSAAQRLGLPVAKESILEPGRAPARELDALVGHEAIRVKDEAQAGASAQREQAHGGGDDRARHERIPAAAISLGDDAGGAVGDHRGDSELARAADGVAGDVREAVASSSGGGLLALRALSPGELKDAELHHIACCGAEQREEQRLHILLRGAVPADEQDAPLHGLTSSTSDS
jgi:hypothetical protein